MIRIAPPLSGQPFSLRNLLRAEQVYKLLAAILLGVVVAYLVVADLWFVAVALLAAVPAFVVLHKAPFFGLLAWLLLAQLLMETETDTLRMAYWLVHRLLPPATLAVIVLSSLLRLSERKLARLGWPEVAMLGYVVVTQFSIAYLNNNFLATTYWVYDRILVPMCLYLIVRLLAPGERDLQQLVPVAFMVCWVQSLVGIISWVAPSLLPSMWISMHVGDRTVGTLTNPAVYTAVLAFASLIVLHAALNRKHGMVRALYVFTFVVANYCIFISFTRSSWLGGMVAVAGLVYAYPKFMLRLLLIAAVLSGVLVGILSEQIGQASQRLDSEQSEESALSRLPVFYAAVRMFQAKPIFGWGYGNFDRYDRDFQARVGDIVNPVKDHASHNLYLSLLAEQGLVGFILFLTPMFWWFWLSLKSLPAMPKEGFSSRKLLLILWLAVAHFVIVTNFFNIIIVYSLGVLWITLGLIGAMAQGYLDQPAAHQQLTGHAHTRGTHTGRTQGGFGDYVI